MMVIAWMFSSTYAALSCPPGSRSNTLLYATLSLSTATLPAAAPKPGVEGDLVIIITYTRFFFGEVSAYFLTRNRRKDEKIPEA